MFIAWLPTYYNQVSMSTCGFSSVWVRATDTQQTCGSSTGNLEICTARPVLLPKQAFKVDLRQSSWLSILPFLMMAIGTNASGWVADTLINSKVWAIVGEHREKLGLQSASTIPLASELMYTWRCSSAAWFASRLSSFTLGVCNDHQSKHRC